MNALCSARHPAVSFRSVAAVLAGDGTITLHDAGADLPPGRADAVVLSRVPVATPDEKVIEAMRPVFEGRRGLVEHTRTNNCEWLQALAILDASDRRAAIARHGAAFDAQDAPAGYRAVPLSALNPNAGNFCRQCDFRNQCQVSLPTCPYIRNRRAQCSYHWRKDSTAVVFKKAAA